jgi:hypothetical protein
MLSLIALSSHIVVVNVAIYGQEIRIRRRCSSLEEEAIYND